MPSPQLSRLFIAPILKNCFSYTVRRSPSSAGWFLFVNSSRKYSIAQKHCSLEYTRSLSSPAANPNDKTKQQTSHSGRRPKFDWTRQQRQGIRDTWMYLAGFTVLFTGMAYAAVPLYRMFCAATGYAGTVRKGHGDLEKMGHMQARKERLIRVGFSANVNSNLTWSFQPEQTEIWVYPGETALAFFKATNPSDQPIVGISTYNIVPFDAGLYFNKVQCFCFEEQMLGPHESVDMPVFFYIDEDFCDDPNLAGVDDIVLSYTFFKSKAGLVLPVPLRPEDRVNRPGLEPGGSLMPASPDGSVGGGARPGEKLEGKPNPLSSPGPTVNSPGGLNLA